RKLIERNPALSALPRLAFQPGKPGNYRIRKEPAAHCVSTIEAVVEVLGRLESSPRRYQPVLEVFEHMVELQLGHAMLTNGQGRFRRREHRRSKLEALRAGLSELLPRLVLVFAETNLIPKAVGAAPGELVLVQAERWATGESVRLLLQPSRPLG